MNNARRENLIFIPVLFGFIVEFFLKFVFNDSLSNDELLFVDIQMKVIAFVMSFYIFYVVIPKSKRLLLFMAALFFACLISSIYTSTINTYIQQSTIDYLEYITFDSMFNFNLIYKCIEIFITTYWLTGIKQNVGIIINFNSNHGGSVGGSGKGFNQ